jgi:hypothetical protein
MTDWHRPLSDLLTDVFDGVMAVQSDHVRVRTRSLELKLPIEVWLRDVDGEQVFIADVPAWRWRTAFDREPGRMNITWETVGTS